MDFESEIDAIMEAYGEQALKQGGRPPDRCAFDAGTSFHLGAIRCAEPRPTGQEGKSQAPALPMICCLAFSCELYLKSLLGEKKARGHDLEKLLERLDSSDRNAVATIYESLTGRSKPKLKADVKAFANAFVDWRYVHEQGRIKLAVHRLALFALALYRHIRDVRPTWEVEPYAEKVIEQPLPEEIIGQISFGGGLHIRAVRTG